MGFFCSVFQCIKLKKYTAKKYMAKKVPQRLQKLEFSYRYDYESLDLVKHSSGNKRGFNLIPLACEHTHSAVSIWNEQSPLY